MRTRVLTKLNGNSPKLIYDGRFNRTCSCKPFRKGKEKRFAEYSLNK